MKCSKIIDSALLIMGIPPQSCPSAAQGGSSDGNSTWRDRLNLYLPSCAASLAAQHFRDTPSLTRHFPTDLFSVNSQGKAQLLLPDDFMLLDTVKLSDWKVAIHEILPAEHPRRKLLGSPWSGIAASPERPACLRVSTGRGDVLLLLGSSAESPALQTATYCPYPATAPDDDGDPAIDWPETLLFPLAKAIAEAAAAK